MTYTNPSEVMDLTSYSVNESDILQAQGIIEVASGRPESLVSRDDDKRWLMYATAWQAAYMQHGDVFQQANVEQAKQDRSTIVIGDRVYALSPLAVEAIKRLSWNKSKSIATQGYDFKTKRLPRWYEF